MLLVSATSDFDKVENIFKQYFSSHSLGEAILIFVLYLHFLMEHAIYFTNGVQGIHIRQQHTENKPKYGSYSLITWSLSLPSKLKTPPFIRESLWDPSIALYRIILIAK